jgi:hypothetical protein
VAKQLRHNWFGSVYELSDVELQRQTWLDLTNINPHWSYIEFVECYPLPEQLEDAFEHGWLTQREFEILTDLGGVVSSHEAPNGDGYDSAAVLDDPAWHRVIAAARQAKQMLLPLVQDTKERDILLGAV